MTKIWKTTGVSKRRKIRLDCEATIRQLDILDAERRREIEILKRMSAAPQYKVKYEDYFSCEETASRMNFELQEFLGVRRQVLSSPYKKILPDRIQDMVENYEEVAAALRGTKYEGFLD